jgi:adenine-specific DNA methylase
MLKRLIEVALPLKEVSEQSAREKGVRYGHISTLHIWWARRPLAACRAVVFASLIPDPDDPECPASFRSLVNETLSENQYKPKNGDGSTVEDTLRNRCLEYVKHLVKWENSNSLHYIEPARRLLAAAHKLLHPTPETDTPKVLDPFAGGGAIPLEALRLGCEAFAVELNPVAHLIELCTLVYPPKYGQPNSRPVPAYIKQLIAHNKAKRKASGQESADLFAEADEPGSKDEIIPDVEITEAEYLKNPLAADVKYWGHWVLGIVRREIGQFYPLDPDGSVPVAYIWARTVKSPDPTVNATVPLLRQLWLCKAAKRKVALQMTPDLKSGKCRFSVVEGKEIGFDPSDGTVKRGDATCPFTGTVAPVKYLRAECRAGRMGHQLLAIITVRPGKVTKQFRSASESDETIVREAERQLKRLQADFGLDVIPQENLPPVGTLGFRVNNYGLTKWCELFNPRQALALATFSLACQKARQIISSRLEGEYAGVVSTYLALCTSRLSDFCSSLCVLKSTGGRGVVHTFGRQALPMVWDYAETSPFNERGANWQSCLEFICGAITSIAVSTCATVQRGSATAIPMENDRCDAVVTDPPYYDAVPYADLSDFFYVWLKRAAKGLHPDVFRTPLTPKSQELIANTTSASRKDGKTPAWYEAGMATAFENVHRVLRADGIFSVMFAHKTTSAWESIISGLLKEGLVVTASWPIDTEMKSRLRGQASAALASSVTLVCRKRPVDAGDGLWDDVRQQLRPVAKERLDFFWSQGIRGADFFISAIGPALGVFGKYERVKKLSGEEVSVGQFLDEVRSLVTTYALNKIMKTTHTATIDPGSQFYVIWKWSYGEAKVPADEAFKLAQALGMDTETMWDRTGVLEKSGENVQAVAVAKRMKVKNLGEPSSPSTPASLIDVLHRLCVFREKNDTEGMTEFLGRSGQGRNPNLWLVAQAVSEILPDGDKEKQLMQGLLNQRDQLEEAGRQLKLF